MSFIQRVRSVPAHRLLKKAVAKARREVKYQWQRWQDARQTSYCPTQPSSLHCYLPTMPIDLLRPYAEQIATTTALYREHYFDLLGSGWVQVAHGMHCVGLEGYRYDRTEPIKVDTSGEWLLPFINPANRAESQRIWRLISTGYVPIDWQLDFKSGYRWRSDDWYRHMPIGHLPGVDVKVPWELARCQHLAQYAWAYALAGAGEAGFAPAPDYIQEFCDEILDFIAANPPRFGVNWNCTMDVAIRAANWLVAYDLLRSYGASFAPAFEREFFRSIYQHGLHIVHNLEWNAEWRSNHYLANIVGLLFIAAYLPRDTEVDGWLAFAVHELDHEVSAQFQDDGTNFEASTSYHRLSAEMVAYAAAIVLALPAEKRNALNTYHLSTHPFPRRVPTAPLNYAFPQSLTFTTKLRKMAEFTQHISKPTGHIPQIGDNDSGRFLKLFPNYERLSVKAAREKYANLENYRALPDEAVYWDEEGLDHRHLIAVIEGLFGVQQQHPEGYLVTQLVGDKHLKLGETDTIAYAAQVRIGNNGDWPNIVSAFHQHGNIKRYNIDAADGGLCDDLHTYGYPDFGLYIFRSRRLYLAVRCGSIGQNDHGGHAHNDPLAVELNIDGTDWIVDPGTYVYTPLPARRQEYRSVSAHFAPQFTTGEPANLVLGIFLLGNEAQAMCLYFGTEGFLGTHQGYGERVLRLITIGDSSITIEDAAESGRILRPLGELQWPPADGIAVSPKYGSKLR